MVECTSLENWRARKGPVGSNPTPSATTGKDSRRCCPRRTSAREEWDEKAGARRREAGSCTISIEIDA